MTGDGWGRGRDRQAWKAVRTLVFARAGGHCEIRGPRCRHAGSTCDGCADQVDHIIPRAIGGPLYDPDNLRAACGPCNQGRRTLRVRAAPSREW